MDRNQQSKNSINFNNTFKSHVKCHPLLIALIVDKNVQGSLVLQNHVQFWRSSLGFRIASFLRKLWGPKLQGHLFILSNVLFVIKPRFKFRALTYYSLDLDGRIFIKANSSLRTVRENLRGNWKQVFF